jgi:hypothetical protein
VGSTLELAWHSEASEPFAMPIEVEVAGKMVKVAMTGGKGSVHLPSPDAHVVLDPHARVLRYDPAIAAWQKQEQAKRNEAEAKAAEKTKS